MMHFHHAGCAKSLFRYSGVLIFYSHHEHFYHGREMVVNRVVTLTPHEKYHIFRHTGHLVLLGAFDRWPWPSWTLLAQTSCYRNENTPRVQGGVARVSPKNSVERSFGNSTWIWRSTKKHLRFQARGEVTKVVFWNTGWWFGTMEFYFSIQLGMSSFQLTFTSYFSEG